MKGIDLLNAIGQIDDELIENAENRSHNHGKNNSRRRIFYWCAAACLLVGLLLGPRIINEIKYSNMPEEMEEVEWDLPSEIYVNFKLYQASPEDEDFNLSLLPPLEYLGEITSVVSSSESPTEEFQANDDILGAKLYQYGDDILVEFEDNCWRYCPYGEEYSDD